MAKQTIIFDFDGVIHSYKSGWKGVDTIADGPVEGIKECIALIREFYRVVVVSTRCYSPGGIEAIQKWLDVQGIVVDAVTGEKPPALLTVDDRAICFDGDPGSLLAKIQNFQPWHKKLTSSKSNLWAIIKCINGTYLGQNEDGFYLTDDIHDASRFYDFKSDMGAFTAKDMAERTIAHFGSLFREDEDVPEAHVFRTLKVEGYDILDLEVNEVLTIK